jgi:hypothetical protein
LFHLLSSFFCNNSFPISKINKLNEFSGEKKGKENKKKEGNVLQ